MKAAIHLYGRALKCRACDSARIAQGLTGSPATLPYPPHPDLELLPWFFSSIGTRWTTSTVSSTIGRARSARTAARTRACSTPACRRSGRSCTKCPALRRSRCVFYGGLARGRYGVRTLFCFRGTVLAAARLSCQLTVWKYIGEVLHCRAAVPHIDRTPVFVS